MKKIIVATVISFSLLILQSCDSKKDAKDDKEIPVGDVPESVQSAFSVKYSSASDIRWEDAHEDTIETYKAKFILNGKKMKAEFDEKGNLVKEEEDD
ncbi:MAG: hypothetical protein E6H07_13605 [Bacteroidetes bacterium]|nr:MAG: hypothetical protein E6H07_13605 [Bacteroidota bacterium]